MKKLELKPENWYWCENCGVRAYVFDCDCHGSTCNGGGCKKCEPQRKLAKQAEENGTAPDIYELKKQALEIGSIGTLIYDWNKNE